MKCPHCNQEHLDGFQFCPATGKKIELMKACTNPDCPDRYKYMLPADSRFCPTCGLKLEENESDKQAILDSIIDSDGNLNFTVDGVDFKMIKVDGGTFWMGADNGERTRTVKGFWGNDKIEEYTDKSVKNYDSDAFNNEPPVHSVTLSSFYIGEKTVTQALWKVVMGSEPTYNGGWETRIGKGDIYPVYRVSYYDIVNEFLPKLNQLTGKNFRLPTEAEWEYAARGGKTSKGYKYAGSNSIDDVAWYYYRDVVKKKSPNELGIYDMSGNVWELCQDWYGSYGSNSQTNPTGPSSGSDRVIRGGGWRDYERSCRVSARNRVSPDWRSDNIGFRLVLPK